MLINRCGKKSVCERTGNRTHTSPGKENGTEFTKATVGMCEPMSIELVSLIRGN